MSAHVSLTPTTIYDVPHHVLEETWHLLRRCGRDGLESVVLWLGRVHPEGRAEILGALFPPQVAYRGPDGLAVEIPQEALTALIAALPPGVRVLVRVHSHPTEAYHSSLDDRNMVIGHEGALSVVVPFFGTGRVSLDTCSVNQLQDDGEWRELSRDEIQSRIAVR